MRTVMTTIFVLSTIILLIVGNIYWKEKTTVSSSGKDSVQTLSNSTNLTSLTKNWPKEAQKTFSSALASGKTYKIAIVGSNVVGKDENGWSVKVKKELEEAFEGTIDVSIHSFDLTSLQFIQDHAYEKIVEEKPDLVLFEPFTLKDTGLIRMEDHHENIRIFMEALKKGNKHVVLILQPANPIYNATYYPGNVRDLMQFAKEEKFPYLDHWGKWPDGQSEDIKDYVTEDNLPNEKGHKLWADYLVHYFIAK
ncbi:hypothetical protein J2S13_002714 [Oikeobacillus pervagus]|uniref:SGNH/GDSL hydrolase family protein n=1 Tax=Oikeobacillus pervagus TaxID=1325931 RepID=A0AAJ1WK92_9BACI|nr:SGNH/GDSL hydrolase family protein [Oikeobacillus pervagus]MDQ0216273.1 hypothetical protein [Oikeobacillus pervagus]